MNKEELDAMRLKASQQISEPAEETPEETPAEEPKEEGEATVEAEKPEGEAEDKTEDKPEEPAEEKDPPRVPFSRFETVNEERIALKERVRLFEEAQERERLEKAAAKGPEGLPEYWVKLYGDSDASKEAYALRQQELADMRETLHADVRKGIQKEQAEAEQRTEETVEDWSTKIDDFAAQSKRKFSDADTDAILDVMDELTPKDAEGNYIVEPIDYLGRAVELYDLRTEKALASKKTAKQTATKLVSAKSEGTLVTPTKEWNGDWRSKLAKMGQ